jgi:hypothetical protein
VHFGQTLSSHFGSAKSSEYGTPADYPFDWLALVKNWDLTVPAILGVVVCLRRWRAQGCVKLETRHPPPCDSGAASLASYNLSGLLPVVWLTLALVVFGIHKPWWPYYYVHTVVPMAWCAGIGIAGVVAWIRRRLAQPSGRATAWLAAGCAIMFAGCALSWMSARVYLQVRAVRNSPQLYTEPVLPEIARFKPYTKFMYAEKSVYSFHAGIPMLPDLAVVHLKRFWAGEMSNGRLSAELADTKPGLILLANDGRAMPFDALLHSDHRLIYMDAEHRLYAEKSISRQPQR